MATRRRGAPDGGDSGQPVLERIIDIDVSEEMRTSFLEYAYSVIHTRALPDARDGLKPVQRRILYRMREMGLTPDRAHVKCARVIGDVMASLHPHGDGAIYDALARMAQPRYGRFSCRSVDRSRLPSRWSRSDNIRAPGGR